MNLDNRKLAIAGMIAQLRERPFSLRLVEAYMKDTGFLIRDIYDREINAPITLLGHVGEETEYTRDFRIDVGSLCPLGKVAILLPKNGINLLVAKAVSSSFLAGNHTLVKLPGKLTNSYPVYKGLVEKHLPGVEFVSNNVSSETFLKGCISSGDIRAIVIYGDDKWIWSYKNAIRNSDIKLIFEGPGKDPQIIMQDADLDLAVEDAVKGGLLNGGQSCSAMERFFVHTDVEPEFLGRLAEKLAVLKIGLPDRDDVSIGPINSMNVLARLMEQVEDACHKGGQLIMGGKPREIGNTNRYAFEPTVIGRCKPNMKIFQEENFGPVYPVTTFSSEEELFAGLDATNYGLNASIYGACPSRLRSYLCANHRNVYFNSTVTSACNIHSRILDGGYRNSGLIWERDKFGFSQKEGSRILLKELSANSC